MDLADALRRRNVWWSTGVVNPDLLYKRIRNEFSSITRNLSSNSVIYLTGPRRLGKTVLLYQTVDHLLKMRIPAEHILYISGDDFSMTGQKANIREILETYCAYILHKNINEPKDRIYVLIDDLHLFKDYQTYLYYYSHSGANFKFIACSPTLPEAEWSENIRGVKLSDPYLGVFFEVPIQPLTLLQFIEFYCAYRQTDFDLIKYKSMLPEDGLFEKPRDHYTALQEGYTYFNDSRAAKLKMIEEYFLAGGYPGYFEAPGLIQWQKTLREDILEHSLYRDIIGLNNIKQPNALRRLLHLIPSIEGAEVSYTAVGAALEIDTVTAINYLSQLEACGLVTICENISAPAGRIIRKNKKVYLTDCGMFNALLGVTRLTHSDYPALCQIQCLAMAREYAGSVGGRAGFLHKGSAAADVAVKKSGLLVAAKTSCSAAASPSPRDVKEISGLLNTRGSAECIMITGDQLRQEGNLYSIPYWML